MGEILKPWLSIHLVLTLLSFIFQISTKNNERAWANNKGKKQIIYWIKEKNGNNLEVKQKKKEEKTVKLKQIESYKLIQFKKIKLCYKCVF